MQQSNYSNGNYIRVRNSINVIQFVGLAVACLCEIVILCYIPQAIDQGYALLFLLPLGFIFMNIFGRLSLNEMPSNIGLTVLYFLELIRLAISPTLVSISGFYNVINYNAKENNILGIVLLFIEAVSIGITLGVRQNIKCIQYQNIDDRNANKRMTRTMVLVVLVTVVVCVLAPEILRSYRSILGLFSDQEFTNVEQSYIVNRYSTSTFKRLMLIIANYLLKVIRILLPAYLMVSLKNYSKWVPQSLAKIVSVILIFSPFLYVDGAIARSLYLSVFLLLLYNNLFGIDRKYLYAPITFAIVLVVVYFVARFRLTSNTSFLVYITDKSIDYFAGANIVGATFNLPRDIGTRFHYLSLDILRSIPFANTIFGLDSNDYVQPFFNRYNMMAGGQIPTTIGMSSYYLSIIFAPAFSILFTTLCKKFGRMINTVKNPYFKLIYTYMAFMCALGVGMYNIEITLGSWIQIILPMYIVARLGYKKEKIIL